MKYIDTYKDGGSKLYSDGGTYLVTCHTLDGNENIIIGTSSDIVQKCVE